MMAPKHKAFESHRSAAGHVMAESMILIKNLIDPLQINDGRFVQEGRKKRAWDLLPRAV